MVNQHGIVWVKGGEMIPPNGLVATTSVIDASINSLTIHLDIHHMKSNI
ncbi:MAG: hypothetical protein JO327_10635 [Nitrososphaeraceae archaeon]|nr:hypothetical protein [Nitrososphaeraceae archaeon]